MNKFHSDATEGRYSFAINAGWNARLNGKDVTDLPMAQALDPEMEAAAFVHGWHRADASERDRMDKEKVA